MPRRRFDEDPYDPVAADLARDVALATAPAANGSATPAPALDPNRHVKPVRALGEGTIKRYRVTDEEDYELKRLLLRLQESSSTKVSLAILNRVSNTLLLRAVDELLREIRDAAPLRQPSNNDPLAYADFEETWVRIVERAVRRRGAKP